MRKTAKTGRAVKTAAGKKAAKKSAVKTKPAPKAKSGTRARKTVVRAKPAAGKKRPAVKPMARAKSAPARKQGVAAVKGNPLLDELREAASGLDADGIRQLIRQAAVLKHNMRVLKEHEERKKMATVDILRKGSGLTNKTTIDVKEADDGSSFIIIINNARNFFALDEMRKLVAICHAAESETDAARRLYNWFTQYRKDVLVDTDIGGAGDQALFTMYRFIKGKYALKQG